MKLTSSDNSSSPFVNSCRSASSFRWASEMKDSFSADGRCWIRRPPAKIGVVIFGVNILDSARWSRGCGASSSRDGDPSDIPYNTNIGLLFTNFKNVLCKITVGPMNEQQPAISAQISHLKINTITKVLIAVETIYSYYFVTWPVMRTNTLIISFTFYKKPFKFKILS